MEEIKQQIIKRAEDRLNIIASPEARQRILIDMKEELKILKEAESVFTNIINIERSEGLMAM